MKELLERLRARIPKAGLWDDDFHAGLAHAYRVAISEIEAYEKRRVDPVPVELKCPRCAHQHVDKGEWRTRLHKTHLCEQCKLEWRPYDYATVGVPPDSVRCDHCGFTGTPYGVGAHMATFHPPLYFGIFEEVYG